MLDWGENALQHSRFRIRTAQSFCYASRKERKQFATQF